MSRPHSARNGWNDLAPSATAPAAVFALKGKRWPVTADGKQAAIEAARARPWWPRCLNPRHPLYERGRWWFVVQEGNDE